VKNVLGAILPLLKKKENGAWVARVQQLKKDYALRYDRGGMLKPQYVLEKLNEFKDDDAIVVTDVGQHQMWAALYMRFKEPRSFLSSGGLGAMGFCLPAAVGAKLGAPHRTVIVVIGDGGIQMTMQELGTAAEQKLPLKIFVLNNQRLGMVRQLQEFYCEKRYFGVDFQFNLDFTALGRLYGMEGYTVETEEQFEFKPGQKLVSKRSHRQQASAADPVPAPVLLQHFVQGTAGRNHGQYVFFPVHDKIKHNRLAGVDCLFNCRSQFGRPFYPDPLGAVSFGQLDEIGIQQLRMGIPPVVKEFLPLSDHPQITVVQDGHINREFVIDRSTELLDIHLNTAVTGYIKDQLVRTAHLDPDCRRQSVSHGSQAAGGDKGARLCKRIVVSRPHLVLAHLGGNPGLALRLPADFPDNSLGLQAILLAIGQRVLFFPGQDLVPPGLGQPGLQDFQQLTQHPFNIAHHRYIYPNIFPNFSRIYVYVGILEGVTRNTVLDIAREKGIPAVEKVFTLFDVYNADEVFLTGTAAEIIPTIQVDGRLIADGKPGNMTRELIAAFRELTKVDGPLIFPKAP
jgi:hypothetical protein